MVDNQKKKDLTTNSPYWPTQRASYEQGDYILIRNSINRWQLGLTAVSLLSICHHTLVSQVGSFRAVWASAPLKWQRRWRGTNTQTRHCWHWTRKPLYLPCCYSTVHWGWNSMNNICLSVHVEGVGLWCTGGYQIKGQGWTIWCNPQSDRGTPLILHTEKRL